MINKRPVGIRSSYVMVHATLEPGTQFDTVLVPGLEAARRAGRHCILEHRPDSVVADLEDPQRRYRIGTLITGLSPSASAKRVIATAQAAPDKPNIVIVSPDPEAAHQLLALGSEDSSNHTVIGIAEEGGPVEAGRIADRLTTLLIQQASGQTQAQA